MKIQSFDDEAAVAVAAAEFIADRVRRQPELRVLVATGNTPMPTYAGLGQMAANNQLDATGIVAFQLDEYEGVSPEDPRSLFGWMQRSFTEPLGIREVISLTDPAAFEAEVTRRGGIDLAILGLGLNGHLGFNEPGSAPDSPTRRLPLTPESLASNRAYWGEEVPSFALTAGMNVILASREVLLLVTGAHKRAILHAALYGPETSVVPASYLRRTALTVITDREAMP